MITSRPESRPTNDSQPSPLPNCEVRPSAERFKKFLGAETMRMVQTIAGTPWLCFVAKAELDIKRRLMEAEPVINSKVVKIRGEK